MERYLVTGALGCIGAWTVRTLVTGGAEVVALDVAAHAPRVDLILSPEERDAATFVTGDIADADAVGRVLDEHWITRVIHLAALQVPVCRADPPLGALVNVVGTVNLFEAVKARRERIPGLVYASSLAVFAPGDAGDGAPVPPDADAHPLTHYGVYKLANEGTARVYWHESGIPSVGLRPCVVYGVGRDQGLTSDPTKAMLAAALGQPYRIGYGGRSQLQLAEDVARAFIAAAGDLGEGALVRNLGGAAAHMSEIVAHIEAAAPGSEIAFDDVQLPFPDELDGGDLGGETPLGEGIARTVEAFRSLAAEGRIAAAA